MSYNYTIDGIGVEGVRFEIPVFPSYCRRPRFKPDTNKAFNSELNIVNKEILQYYIRKSRKDFRNYNGTYCSRNFFFKGVPVAVSIKGIAGVQNEDLGHLNELEAMALYKGQLWYDEEMIDIDNFSKIILDSLTGEVYEDDCQICELNTSLRLGEEDKIIIEIKPADIVTTGEVSDIYSGHRNIKRAVEELTGIKNSRIEDCKDMLDSYISRENKKRL